MWIDRCTDKCVDASYWVLGVEGMADAVGVDERIRGLLLRPSTIAPPRIARPTQTKKIKTKKDDGL